MTTPILSNRIYFFLFTLLAVAYLPGLFVPLMDNDAGHHASIALHMFNTGDYVSLVDYKGAYMDKPHFLFWINSLSFHIFGVTSFAYKFPSFLFSIFGIYAIYRLGKELYDNETAKLAALMAASSFCVILANSDVRMDAILSACISFATWQLIAFVHHRKNIYLLGAALGLAIGFSTKGHVGLVPPVIGLLFYILYRKEWKLLYDWHWLIVILLFGIFISPVVYCYYLQFNLHPETNVQGMTHINGIKFILWDQSFERIGGNRFGSDGGNDKFFFLHTFLWTYAPWCITAYVAVGHRIKYFSQRKQEWASTAVFIMLALLINFSKFKLPHYLPVLAPATAMMVSSYFTANWNNKGTIKLLYIIQITASVLLVLLAALVNLWAFKLQQVWMMIGGALLLALYIFLLYYKGFEKLQRAIVVSVVSITLLFFLLNTNFYQQLLTYQGGKPLAEKTRGIVDPKDVYYYKDFLSFSYDFYTTTFRKEYNDSLLQSGKPFWLVYKRSQQENIDAFGLRFGRRFSAPDFEITRMNASFINPKTRPASLDEMIIVEVLGKASN